MWCVKAATQWLVSAYVSTLIAACVADTALRILEGRGAHPREYPFVVQLEQYQRKLVNNKTLSITQPYCTGAALSTTWTLTANHCGENRPSPQKKIKIRIRYGFPLGKPSKGDSFSNILKLKSLANKGDAIKNDVMLIHSDPIVIKTYAKISAVDYSTLYGHRVTLVGFGYMAKKLEVLQLPFYSGEPLQVWDRAMVRSCDDVVEYPSMCVVPECGEWKSAFQGDSGGPVLHPSGVIGVVSRGFAGRILSRTLTADVITPISPYVDWISSVTNRERIKQNGTVDEGIKPDIQ